LFQSIAEARHPRGIFFERDASEFRGFAEANDAGDIFGAGAEATLVVAAVEKLAEARAALDEERADAFGSVELVAGEREQIELQGFDIEGNFCGGLHGVRMEVYIGFGGDTANFSERLDGAEFVVGVHHGDENGFGAKGAAELVEINKAIPINGEIADGDALLFKGLAGVENGFVFDGGGDYVRGS